MLTLLLAIAAHAATIEITQTDDLWASIAALTPGDELVVHEGTWSSQSSSGSWFREVILNGTAADPIIVRVADGETVVIQGDTGGSQNTINMGGSYFTFRGFELSHGSHGLRMETSAHVVLEDLHIHDTADVGLSMNRTGQTFEDITVRGTHIHDTDGTGECMYLGCNNDGCQVFDSVIEWNYCHDTSGSQGDGIELKSGSYNNVIRHNVVHDVIYPGIITYGASGRGNNTVEGNLIWNVQDNGIQTVGEALVRNNIVLSSGGNGIASKPSQGQDVHDLTIVHNTVVGAGDSCLRGNEWGGAPNIVVANNAFLCAGANAIKLPNGDGGVTFIANAVEGNDESGAGFAASAAADLVDAAARDVYPADGSVLIDAGDGAHAALDAADCDLRPGVPDVGALEHGGLGSGPIPESFKQCVEGGPDDTGQPDDTGPAGDDTGPGADDTGTTPDDTGCGCASTSGSPAVLALLLPALLIRRRR